MNFLTLISLLTIEVLICFTTLSVSKHAGGPFGGKRRPENHRRLDFVRFHHRKVNKLSLLPHDKNGFAHGIQTTKSPDKQNHVHPSNKTFSEKHGGGFDLKAQGSGSLEYVKLPNKCSRSLNDGWGNGVERGNRSAVQQFVDGDKLHITGKHPSNWMFCVDVPDGETSVYPIRIKECQLDQNEQWVFHHSPWAPDSSWAVIKSVSTDECLDVLSEDTDDGTAVGAFGCSEEGENQLWKVVPQGDGTVRLKSYQSCKCLTIKTLSKRECGRGHVLEISECDGNPRLEQDWTLRKVAKHSITLYEYPNYKGFHFSLHSNGECVDVSTINDDPVNSLRVHGGCWVVFRERNCEGRNHMFTPDDDAKSKGFRDVIKSAIPCTIQD